MKINAGKPNYIVDVKTGYQLINMLKSLFKLHNIEYEHPILSGQFFTEKQYSIEELSQFAYHCSKYIGDMKHGPVGSIYFHPYHG